MPANVIPSNNIVIVGGGLAGLFCALKLAPHPVTLLTGAPLGAGASSVWAQGGIAAAVMDGDTPEAHARDTILAGAGIVDARARSPWRARPARIDDPVLWRAVRSRSRGPSSVSREAAHSARRIVRVKGDQAGRAIMAALTAAVANTPSIDVVSGFAVEDLLMRDGRITGVAARSLDGARLLRLSASAIVLATGGAGYLYAVTTNPPEARGTGLAIAARAGALIADPEFVQFHPIMIAIARDPAPLATEALRGDGATLVNSRGERFMARIHSDAELAPRDVVARGVFAEIAAGRGAFLDARAAIGPAFAQRFPSVYASCTAAGIDPAHDLIPIAPPRTTTWVELRSTNAAGPRSQALGDRRMRRNRRARCQLVVRTAV
jgi:L-aspartate oxidase